MGQVQAGVLDEGDAGVHAPPGQATLYVCGGDPVDGEGGDSAAALTLVVHVHADEPYQVDDPAASAALTQP